MKRRLYLILLSFLILICGCAEIDDNHPSDIDEKDPIEIEGKEPSNLIEPEIIDIKLDSPIIKIENNLITWNEIEKAKQYEIIINDNFYYTVECNYNITNYEDGFYNVKVRALGYEENNMKYIDSEYSNEEKMLINYVEIKVILPNEEMSIYLKYEEDILRDINWIQILKERGYYINDCCEDLYLDQGFTQWYHGWFIDSVEQAIDMYAKDNVIIIYPKVRKLTEIVPFESFNTKFNCCVYIKENIKPQIIKSYDEFISFINNYKLYSDIKIDEYYKEYDFSSKFLVACFNCDTSICCKHKITNIIYIDEVTNALNLNYYSRTFECYCTDNNNFFGQFLELDNKYLEYANNGITIDHLNYRHHNNPYDDFRYHKECLNCGKCMFNDCHLPSDVLCQCKQKS